MMPRAFNFPVGAESGSRWHQTPKLRTTALRTIPRVAVNSGHGVSLASSKAELEAIADRLAVESPQTPAEAGASGQCL